MVIIIIIIIIVIIIIIIIIITIIITMIVSIFIILSPWEPTDGLEGKLTTTKYYNLMGDLQLL